jgi:hypothetical protein
MKNAGPHEGPAQETYRSELDNPCDNVSPAGPATYRDEPEGIDFDWITDKSDVVISEQPATAVYVNLQNAIVIRQESCNGDDDPIIRIRPHNIEALIERLRTVARSMEGTQ